MQSQPFTSRTIDRANSICQEQLGEQQSASNSTSQLETVYKTQRSTSKNETLQNKEKDNNEKNKYEYQKRPGTSGIGGQLYETKLLTLILLRVLIKHDIIIEFLLGTNIYDLGAMDDIVLRYKKRGSIKSKIIFIQAKHREDPNKEKLTLDDIFKSNGDFSFQKYLQSYLKTQQILHSGKNNLMFQNQNDVECDYLIYTPVAQSIPKSKILQCRDCDVEAIIKTNNNGKIFQLKYDDQDVETLLVSVRKSRVILLAKSVAKNIVKGNFRNVMKIDIIKQYHVYLAQNVISIEDSETIQKVSDSCVSNKENCYYNGKFRESFLTSNDENLLLMKLVIREELGDILKNTQNTTPDEEGKRLKDICFKLPVDFGNRVFCFYGSDEKQERRLNHMCSIFKKLFENVVDEDVNYKYVKLDENSIGPDKIIQANDLGICWLGGLVGNLLINDHTTNALMFNLSEDGLSSDNIKILRQLEKEHNLNKFRFYLNIYELPKLTLYDIERDKKLIKDFLGKLKFYTNQAKEDEVENVIKNEIKSYHIQQTSHDFLQHNKCDLIYLMFHDEVQRWWKQPQSASYLTETCQFYKQAEQYVLSSPLVNVMNYIYRKEMQNVLIQFDKESIQSLHLDEFLNSHDKFMVFFSDETIFSSIKLIQYFDSIQKSDDCIIIDLDSMIFKNSFETLKQEIKNSTRSVLVVTNQEQSDIDYLYDKVEQIVGLFKGKIILITCSSLETELRIMLNDNKIQKDNKNTFKSLSSEICRIIQDERKVTFQGVEVTVNEVFDDTILNLLSPELLRKLMCNQNIEIGKSLTNSVYHKTIDYYTHRSLCRCITLNIDKHKDIFLYYKDDINTNSTGVEKNDIIVTTDSASVFDEICRKNTEANVHWFLSNNYHANIIWKQSHGSIQTIIKYVEKGSHQDFTTEVKTLKDIKENVVIVCAGPGTGKSTLLSHLAINTKRLHPNIWILNLNLLDHIDQFSEWKDEGVKITLKEAFKMLYISTLNMKENLIEIFKENVSELITVNENEIHLSDHYKKYLPGIDLSEIILLAHFYNNKCLTVLLDGFDEISPDYSDEVIQMLSVLNNSKIAQLWITSRPCYRLDQLELALGTMSFTLNLLQINQQKLMLHNVWSKMLGYTVDFASVSHFYDITIKGNYHNDTEEKFASLPLHLYMMAKVFENCFRGFLKRMISLREFRDASNLITLYETFTNIKFFDIRFGEKKLSMNTKDPDVRKMIDKERRLFIKNHKITAAYLLLDKSIFLSDSDMAEVQEFINNVSVSDEKSEIIECIIGNNPKFVHFTFAEYFAVEHFFDKLRSVHVTSSMWQYLMEQLLTSERFMGIRRFINSKLEIDPYLSIELQRTEVYSTVYNILIAKLDINLHVALNEKLDEIVNFILKCFKPFLHKCNISDFLKMLLDNSKTFCVFCSAIKGRTKMIIRSLIDLVMDIDKHKLKELLQCQSRGICKPLFVSLSLTDTISAISLLGNYFPDLLFEVLIMPNIMLNNKSTLAHSLGTNGHQLLYIYHYLQEESKERLLEIFSVTDVYDQTPLHYAALENDYDFFMKINECFEEETFRIMCTTPNKLGFTPICMFSYHKPNFKKLKALLEIVYEDPGIEVKEFVFTKLSELHPKDVSIFETMDINVFFKTKRTFINPGPNDPPKTPIGLLAAFLGH